MKYERINQFGQASTIEIAECQFCHYLDNHMMLDGKTKYGPWAYMCPRCFQNHGITMTKGLATVWFPVEEQV